MEQVNGSVLGRIQKLIAMRDHANTTEAEASLAAEHVQRMLQDNGLTMAQVEAAGGNTADVGGTRSKVQSTRRAMYEYQRHLMANLADNNFCLHVITQIVNEKPLYSGGRGKTSRVHVLIGRAINVQATELMYDYLDTTMRRLATEAGISYRETRQFNYFLEGASTRVCERLADKRREREREEKARKAEQQAQGNGSGTELMVMDVYGSERDLNNDVLNGFPPGTTATRRRENEAQNAARKAKEEALVAQGMDPTVAFYMSYGYGEEQAVSAAATWRNQSRRAQRGRGGRSHGWTNDDRKAYEKHNSDAYQAGRAAGNSIGLDTQVGKDKRKLIG